MFETFQIFSEGINGVTPVVIYSLYWLWTEAYLHWDCQTTDESIRDGDLPGLANLWAILSIHSIRKMIIIWKRDHRRTTEAKRTPSSEKGWKVLPPHAFAKHSQSWTFTLLLMKSLKLFFSFYVLVLVLLPVMVGGGARGPDIKSAVNCPQNKRKRFAFFRDILGWEYDYDHSMWFTSFGEFPCPEVIPEFVLYKTLNHSVSDR